MIYQLFYYAYLIFRICLNILWVIRDVATVGIPWAAMLFFTLWCFFKIFRSSTPNSKLVTQVLGPDPNKTDSGVTWAFAKGGACFDAPGNTLTAIKHVNN